MRTVSIAFLLLTLAISTFFIHVPHKGEIGFLLNPNVKLSYNQYVWMLGEPVIIPIVLAWIIWVEVKKYKEIAKWYLLILIADGFLWILSYDDPLKGHKINWNIIKTALFILAIGYELWKTRRILKEG